MPVSASAEESGHVLVFLRPFLEFFVGEGNVTDHLVRKLAHFTEFTVLGVELYATVGLWRDRRYSVAESGDGATDEKNSLQTQHRLWSFLLPLNLGFIAAFLDESIQMLSDRGDQIIDVWLDTAGVAFGCLVGLIVMGVWERNRLTKARIGELNDKTCRVK